MAVSFLTKILNASFMVSMCATCPTLLLYLIVLTVRSEEYTLLDSYILIESPILLTSTLLGQNIVLITSFSNSINLYLNISDEGIFQ
jgi:predicted membrane-bound spermidine synthase